MVREIIRFPTSVHELEAQVAHFAGVANFPKVMGVIDCTHEEKPGSLFGRGNLCE
ncbi:hypothetical protein DPMN_038898 [Dreissena polymorpha]|uniref:Uncharacterized protein n=1 Tax=Dreissena polymorpha TaxID=45954 RepID=A0A9D4RR67_DREPO|nr:hypothetical protein DPMN_038898 [Dreissena polymorpha]